MHCKILGADKDEWMEMCLGWKDVLMFGQNSDTANNGWPMSLHVHGGVTKMESQDLFRHPIKAQECFFISAD
jgi:hypothetical protein